MNENNILDVFYKLLDDKKMKDINEFKMVDLTEKWVESTERNYKRFTAVIKNDLFEAIESTEIDQETTEKFKRVLKDIERQWDYIKTIDQVVTGAFYDLQEYYFIQGYKANSELGEQLKRLLDNKSI